VLNGGIDRGVLLVKVNYLTFYVILLQKRMGYRDFISPACFKINVRMFFYASDDLKIDRSCSIKMLSFLGCWQ